MNTVKPSRLRRVLVVLHRYTGLALGLAFVVLGLTGSAAVYWRELDRAMRPSLAVEERNEPKLSLDALLAVAKNSDPQRHKPWTLEMQYDAKSPVYAIYSRPEERPIEFGSNLYVAIDPYDGRVVDRWYYGETPATWLIDLHIMFMAGLAGHQLVGWLGIVLIAFSLTGLYLWWPRGRFAKRDFTVKTGAGASRLELDLHKAFGFYTLPFMILFGLTGYMMVFPATMKGLVRAIAPDSLAIETPRDIHGGNEAHGTSTAHGMHGHKDTRYIESTPRPGVSPIGVDRAVELALREFPGSKLMRISTPGGEKGVYGVTLRHPTERMHKTYPMTEVWLDQYDGHVLVKSDPRTHSFGQKFIDSPLPLHNGEALGAFGRVLAVILGLIPLGLFVTGLLQWLRRQRLRSRSGTA